VTTDAPVMADVAAARVTTDAPVPINDCPSGALAGAFIAFSKVCSALAVLALRYAPASALSKLTNYS